MSSLTLYTYPGNFRAFKALIAAEYNNVSVDVPVFRMGADSKNAEFKAKNPLGKVPVLETAQGCIFESNAIARYIARLRQDTELLGSSFIQQGQVDSWIDFSTNELEVPTTMWVYPILGYIQNKDEVTKKAQGDTKKALAILNNHLSTRTYMVGRQITLADIVLASALYYPMKLVLDAKARKAFTNVERWFINCINQPAFKAVLGDFTFCKQVQIAPGGAAPAAAAKGGKKKKAAAKQEKKEKQVEAPKPKKEVNPLKALPPSSLNLDEWKKMYSNNNIVEVAMPWFFENFDKEGWSVWFHNYNYNSENTVGWMTSNQVGGFHSRFEAMRKFAFGITHILAEDENTPPFNVAGAFMTRSTNMDAMMEANPDCEYYTWTKVDMDNAEDRAKLTAIWGANDDLGYGDASNVNGEKVFDWRIFK